MMYQFQYQEQHVNKACITSAGGQARVGHYIAPPVSVQPHNMHTNTAGTYVKVASDDPMDGAAAPPASISRDQAVLAAAAVLAPRSAHLERAMAVVAAAASAASAGGNGSQVGAAALAAAAALVGASETYELYVPTPGAWCASSKSAFSGSSYCDLMCFGRKDSIW